MTNYCNFELVAQLWDEILQKHWDYLDAEETLAKFEMRKELEKRLQDYLCMIPHDKKFFLTETKLVLKRSITQNSDFSAYKAANGFESISQYANNLFTKPWRKEYKVIKMYSGFYQHEIKANLVDSEKLFEAMGYKLMPNQTLVLEGAICPDQVTNVARDAMAAMVECEIMKQIYSGLTAKQLSSSWLEIFNFREKHIGTIPKMVKAMTAAILDKQQQRKSKAVSQENCYHNHQINSCNIHQCVPNQQPPSHYYTPQPQPPVPQTGYHHGPPPCSVHPHQTVYGSYNNGQIPPPIPHSKSLDYYDPVLHSGGYMNSHYHHPHRHSMDQTFDYGSPQLSQGYDCVDGDHQCANVTYNNHPYNVSGNRVPLPYDLGTSYPPQHLPPPPLPPQPTYYSRLQHPNTEQQFGNNGTDFYCPVMVGGSGQQYLANNVSSPLVPMDKLIDFDQQHQQQSNGSTMRGNGYYSKRDKEQQSDNYLPTTLMTKSHHNGGVQNHYNQPTLGMDIPPPLFARNMAKASGHKQHYQMAEKTMKNLNLSDFDSFEDDNSSSQPRSNKNMDGIGNYESWNYVFRNLEQQGFNQDKELPDDTAEELDGINDGFKTVTDHNHRKSSLSHKRATSALVNNQKSLDQHHAKHNPQTMTTNDNCGRGNQDRSDSNKIVTQPKVQSSRSTIGTMTSPAVTSSKLEKTNTNSYHQPPTTRPVSSTSKMAASQSTTTNVSNNNNSNSFSSSMSSKKSATTKNGGLAVTNANYCVLAKKANGTGVGSLTGNGTSGDNNHVVTNISTSSGAIEWNCHFCTYLNPVGKRICDMCAKSRDFNLDGTKNKATCV